MRRSCLVRSRLMVLVATLMVLGGCQSWRDVQMKTDVENLKREVARLKKQNGAGGDLNEVRRRLADLAASVESLRTEVGLLEGRIEAAQHDNEENDAELKKVKADLDAKLARVEEQLSLLRSSLGAGTNPVTTPVPTPAPGVSPTTSPTAAAPTVTPTPVAAKTPVPAETDEVVYRRGIELLDGEKFAPSRAAFEELIKRYPTSKLADNSRFWIGESYYRQKEYASAILEYQKVVDDYPKGDKVPAALYKQGLAFLEIGEKEGGIATLQQLVSRYPKSREAHEARNRIKKAK